MGSEGSDWDRRKMGEKVGTRREQKKGGIRGKQHNIRTLQLKTILRTA